ncbi:MAG: type IX secretion system membrane protein PorP/SprF [Flavobacteriales bacterium]|nr:type IX secretion system membrane protein PorP/SprF [Flavobacteriales bacterium]MCB9166131.1 type IX secretion system membrane protein PorP/SprF [Flavobacteriales bacterium]
MNPRWHLGWTIVMCISGLHAQDAQFTQFYAVPTYVSPAFAGTSLQSRCALAYRDQWPSIPGAFVTYDASYDHYLRNMNSGVGLLITHDRAGSGALRYTSIAAQYAYEIELKRKVFLRPALQVGIVDHAVDLNKLTFGDQLVRGDEIATYENIDRREVKYADVGAGLLFFSPTNWLGIAFHHMNEPDQSLLLNETKVPMKLSLHGGHRSAIRTRIIQKHPQSAVFAFNYRAQGEYDQLDLGAYYEREPFYTGLWYRGIPLLKGYAPGHPNNDAIALLVGFIVKDMRIGYSYDLTISQLGARSGGAHELTLGYEFADRRKKKAMSKRRVVPCAKF